VLTRMRIWLPDAPGVLGALAAEIGAVCKGIRTIPGAGVEEVRQLSTVAQDREDTVLNAAAAILQAATPTAAMNSLSGQLMSLFDLTWLAVADLGTETFREVHGDVPSIAWVNAFAQGSQSGADPSNDTTRSGVFVEAIPDTDLTVCGGRPAPIRRRERHGIAMLVLVTARFVDALGWREHAH
jgi:hypothetical protein